MRFIYADSLDYVDPQYDFLADCSSPDRKAYWDDRFSHEMFPSPPYDGVLVSRGIVGDHRFPGKYSESQAMRFRRDGARKFLRLDTPALRHLPVFGDCGAFSYYRLQTPPYSTDDTVEYYLDAGFTHGCSVDHVIFDFDRTLPGMTGGSEDARVRFDITLENADSFLQATQSLRPAFTPLGVVQGWSPGSIAEAARRLVAMGYDYLAIGGMVPLAAPAVHACLQAVCAVLPANVRLHLLGFAKADQIQEFRGYQVASFDSTSPLLRAFKDARRNFYLPNKTGSGVRYFSAIRIPQALENPKLMRLAKAGVVQQEKLRRAERSALAGIRAYAACQMNLEDSLDAIMAYSGFLLIDPREPSRSLDKQLDRLAQQYRETLESRPWQICECAICRDCGVEVIIFRSSNRNKRRGMHNLWTFHQLVRRQAGAEVCVA